MGNIHGISCTANNYLKQAWNDIKNEYEKNQTYSITLFENTLVCFMRLYKEIRRQQAEDYIPCLECDSLEKEFEEIQNDNDLSLFMKTLRTNWICPYISRHLLSLNPLQARCRRYSRGER